jgi:hypothetical protein
LATDEHGYTRIRKVKSEYSSPVTAFYIVTAGSQFLFCDPAVSESSGIYKIRAGRFSGLAARLG